MSFPSSDHRPADGSSPALRTPWRTVDQAAARALVGPRTIYNEISAGRLMAAKIGGRRELRLKDEWVDAWLEAQATPVMVRR